MKNRFSSPRLEELKKKKRIVLRNKILLFSFFFLVLLIGFIFLLNWSKIRINEVNIFGNKVADVESISEVVRTDISGKYLWIIPKNNILFYPKNKIKKELADKFRRLKNISFNIKNAENLEITVSEYVGKYTWCGPNVNLEARPLGENKCYFLDQNGYLFDEAPYFSGNIYFRFYGPIKYDNDSPIGASFIPDHFKEIISFKENLEKMNLHPTAFFEMGGLDYTGEGSISLSGAPTASPHIDFKLDSDYQKLVENLQAVITTEPLKMDLKSKFSSLLYIDLRFGNKVYYKFK